MLSACMETSSVVSFVAFKTTSQITIRDFRFLSTGFTNNANYSSLSLRTSDLFPLRSIFASFTIKSVTGKKSYRTSFYLAWWTDLGTLLTYTISKGNGSTSFMPTPMKNSLRAPFIDSQTVTIQDIFCL